MFMTTRYAKDPAKSLKNGGCLALGRKIIKLRLQSRMSKKTDILSYSSVPHSNCITSYICRLANYISARVSDRTKKYGQTQKLIFFYLASVHNLATLIGMLE